MLSARMGRGGGPCVEVVPTINWTGDYRKLKVTVTAPGDDETAGSRVPFRSIPFNSVRFVSFICLS